MHALSRQSGLLAALQQQATPGMQLHPALGFNNTTTMPLTKAQRQYIGEADLNVVSKATLARKFRCNVCTITRWVEEGKKAKPKYGGVCKPGKPRKLQRARAAAVRRSGKAGHSARELAARESKISQQRVSRSTVSREMHRGNIDLRYMPISHGQVLRPDNVNARATFCQQHQSSHTGNWVFVDSKIL
jgi:DNA invertase Pin-like site-specific DNA recombinase